MPDSFLDVGVVYGNGREIHFPDAVSRGILHECGGERSARIEGAHEAVHPFTELVL